MYKGNPHRDHPLWLAACWIGIAIAAALFFGWDPTGGAVHAAWERAYERHALLITAIIFVSCAARFASAVRRGRERVHRSLWNLLLPATYLAVATLLVLVQLLLAFDAYMTSQSALRRNGTVTSSLSHSR